MTTPYKDLFMRDTLTDQATMPSTNGVPYHSPDIIPHAQVAHPQDYFSRNYGQNVSINAEYGRTNYIYVRCKNLADAAVSGTIKVYWTEASLFMFPNTWSHQNIQLANGNGEIPTGSIAAGAIWVSPEAFVWTPATPNSHGYCMIAVCATSDHPSDIPTGEFTWGDLSYWVRNHPNVCWHNLGTVNNYPDPQYDKLLAVHNETGAETDIMFKTVLSSDFPAGTVVSHLCDPLSINKQITTTASGRTIRTTGGVPAGFSGSLEVMVRVPTGQTYPNNPGEVSTKSFVTSDASDANLFEYGDPVETAAAKSDLQALLSDVGRLVEVGNYTTRFTST